MSSCFNTLPATYTTKLHNNRSFTSLLIQEVLELTICIMQHDEYTDKDQFITSVSEYLTESANLGVGSFVVQSAKCINVLLVGRSQSGKSTIAATLQNPQVAVAGRGYAKTRRAECKAYTLTDLETSQVYCLNVIDTPGLSERRIDVTESRNDDEILNLARLCITENLTNLHAVCFVSVAGQTHELDTDVFLKLKDFLGPSYSESAMLILTKCDRTSDRRIEKIKKDLEVHAPTREILEFCKLGVFEFGTVDYEVLQNLAEREDGVSRQQEEIRYQLKRQEPRRRALLKCFIECAKRANPITQLDAVYKAAQEATAMAVELQVKKQILDVQAQMNHLKSEYERERKKSWQVLSLEKREQFEKWTGEAISFHEEAVRQKWSSEKREHLQRVNRQARSYWSEETQQWYREWEAFHQRYARLMLDLEDSKCTIL